MTTTYELYTNENGTPKAVEGKAPAIIERVEALETSVESLEETLDNGVVTSVNGQTGDVSVDVGVTSFNGEKGAVTYSAPVSSVDGQTGAVNLSNIYQQKGNYLTEAPVTSVNGQTGAVTLDVGGSPYTVPTGGLVTVNISIAGNGYAIYNAPCNLLTAECSIANGADMYINGACVTQVARSGQLRIANGTEIGFINSDRFSTDVDFRYLPIQ